MGAGDQQHVATAPSPPLIMQSMLIMQLALIMHAVSLMRVAWTSESRCGHHAIDTRATRRRARRVERVWMARWLVA